MKKLMNLKKDKIKETRDWSEKRCRRWDTVLIWKKMKKVEQDVDLWKDERGWTRCWFAKR